MLAHRSITVRRTGVPVSTSIRQWPSPEWNFARARVERGLRVPEECLAAHAALVRTRLRTLAPLLAVLALAWLPIEAAWSGPDAFWLPAMLRVAIAAVLVGQLALLPGLRAPAAVNVFMWVQAIGFGLLQWLVVSSRGTSPGIDYGLFPCLVVAQLALLPLPWSRGLLAALAPAAQLAVTLASGRTVAASTNVLLFLLIAGVAVWASHAQLRLLVDLLGARTDAAHDPLTGLANRRVASARLEAERQRALRQGVSLSVLMLDLDRFKRINDRWGHVHGDTVLVAVAQALTGELRGADLAVRYGGEEFMAILPDTASAGAMQVAERIRERIAELRIALPEATETITVSIGVATLFPEDTVETIVARADTALYVAKEAGRNRCVAALEPA